MRTKFFLNSFFVPFAHRTIFQDLTMTWTFLLLLLLLVIFLQSSAETIRNIVFFQTSYKAQHKKSFFLVTQLRYGRNRSLFGKKIERLLIHHGSFISSCKLAYSRCKRYKFCIKPENLLCSQGMTERNRKSYFCDDISISGEILFLYEIVFMTESWS